MKSFTTPFNCRRHESIFHQENKGDNNDLDTDDEDEQDNDDSQAKSDCADAETGDDHTDDEQDADDDIDPGWYNQFWKFLIKETFDQMESFPHDFDHLLSPPYFENFMKHLAIQHKGFLFYNRARGQSELSNKIDETVEYFEDKLNHDKDEALQNAWKNREFQFKKLLQKNKDLFHEKLNNETKNTDDVDEGAATTSMYQNYYQHMMGN